MNVIDMAELLTTQHSSLDKKTAKAVVEAVFKAIGESANKGEEVSIPGFGKFKVTESKARTGRNPATNETIQISAKKKLAFSAAKQLKDSMNPSPAAGKAKPKAKK